MKNNLMTLLFLIVSRAAQRFTVNQGTSYREMANLKMSLLYLRLVKTSRLLFLSSLGIGVCLVFLLSSLILFHVTFFLYAPCTMEAKMWVGFICAAVYLFIAAKAFSYVFAEDKWVKIFHAQNIFKKLEEESHAAQTSPKQV